MGLLARSLTIYRYPMKDSWFKNSDKAWSSEAKETLEELANTLKRNVEMRVRRGDVRSAVLRLLLETPMHGYQIIQEIETRSDGVWKPSPGSVYPTLQLLADEGLIVAHESEGRRTFSLTEAGREVASAEMDTPAPWSTTSERPSGPRSALAASGLKLARAASDVARSGSNEQIAQATAIIDETTKALAAILAHD
jgi:DNA-binding PadR family transcriptional regulator